MVVYKGATHGWDIGANFTKTAANGQRVTYRYNAKISADSAERAFEFFDKNVKTVNPKP